jgi:hypothetical protein
LTEVTLGACEGLIPWGRVRAVAAAGVAHVDLLHAMIALQIVNL